MISAGFWILPDGEYFYCEISHIMKVMEYPPLFGYTKEGISEIYAKHGEVEGTEGEARKEILLNLIDRGCIRLRRYKEYWSVNVRKLTRARVDLLVDFFENITQGNMVKLFGFQEEDIYMPVRIDAPNYSKDINVKDILDGVLYKEKEERNPDNKVFYRYSLKFDPFTERGIPDNWIHNWGLSHMSERYFKPAKHLQEYMKKKK